MSVFQTRYGQELASLGISALKKYARFSVYARTRQGNCSVSLMLRMVSGLYGGFAVGRASVIRYM